MRTHACGELRATEVGESVALCGWVWRQRDHGGVTFVDLRDREGLVQVVFHPEEAPEAHAAAQAFKVESVVRVLGEVRARPAGTVNPDLPTGEVEVAAREVEVLAVSDTPPFPVEDRIEASEELRLRYRYLDLRRPEMTRVLALRHTINRIIREEMESRGFLEVETPILTRSTPEGARDFLVPSRAWPGTFYALPQSPQQLKQLLMVAGQDRYYVFAVIEPVYARVLREVHGVEVPTPFPRIPYDEMLARYGTDKPDLRYGMELADLGSVFAGTGFRAFASALADGGIVKGLAAPGGAELSRKELDDLVQVARARGAAGLVWLVVEPDGVRSPVEKHLTSDEVAGVRSATGAGPGDLVLVVADRPDRVNVALDGLRRHLAGRLRLIPQGEWRFAWYLEPPLFDWSDEEGKWVSNHHPFTAPLGDDLGPETARARAYDLVLNGFEMGGGSIRIHRPDVQRRVFEVLGLSDREIDEKFGHLLTAFRYGVPPHGGIAMGIDRLVMLMAGKDSLRDVTAFPKAQSGADPLTGAPAPVPADQLDELGIAVVAPSGEDG
jgi:aspartyl-tRNA synthetase